MTELRFPKPARNTRQSAKRGRTSKRRKGRKALRLECDRIFAIAIKDRDGWACRACGSHMRPQCAHLVSRRYNATRWDLQNACCLCSRCHLKFTYDPIGWEIWCDERWPGRLAQLKTRAKAGVKHVDYEAILASLTGGPKYEV